MGVYSTIACSQSFSLRTSNSFETPRSGVKFNLHLRSQAIDSNSTVIYGDEGIVLPTNINHFQELNDLEVFTATTMGLGLWRLRPIMRPNIKAIAARMEGIIRQCCMDDDLHTGHTGEFEYWDTLDPTGEKDHSDPFFATTTRDPENGDSRYPRFQIENRVYVSRVFRKIHMELASRQDGIQSFRLIMYPRIRFDLPILYMNVIADSKRIRLAIADTSPVRWDKSLPDFYSEAVNHLQSHYCTQRALPTWGQEFFSSFCVNISPTNIEETYQFFAYICSLTRLHLEVARLLKPVNSYRVQKVTEITECHSRFCTGQLKDCPTRPILGSAFGDIKAEKYLRTFTYDSFSSAARHFNVSRNGRQ
jgi:phycocyanobilin:ferredoxin oxidoreductase